MKDEGMWNGRWGRGSKRISVAGDEVDKLLDKKQTEGTSVIGRLEKQ